MRLVRIGLVALSLLIATPALAQALSTGRAGGIGLGAESMAITGTAGDTIGPTGAAFVFDRPSWHVAGLLAMDSQGATDLFVGGRFFYHLHQGTMSDFSVGGGLGILSFGDDGPGNNDRTDIVVEGATQLRAFVTPNVAIGASVGVGFVIVDDDNGDDYFVLGGQVLTAAGIWYFFQ